MQDETRTVLSQLIETYGTDLVDDHRRLRSMLADKLPRARRDAQRIVLAAEEGIPRRILTVGDDPSGTLRMQLARSLQSERDMTPDAADWAVDAWAAALGVDLGGLVRAAPGDETRTIPGPTEDDEPPSKRQWPASWLVGGGGVAVAAILLFVLGPFGRITPPGPGGSQSPSANQTAVLSESPGSSAPESPASTPSATATPLPERTPAPTPLPLRAQLEDWIPADVVPTCFELGDLSRRDYGPYQYALSCEAPKATFVWYLLYSDIAGMNRGYGVAAASTIGTRRDFGDCPIDLPSEGTWRFTGEEGARGRLACDAVDTYSWLYWTMPYAQVMGYMQRGDGDMQRLFSGWRELGTVRP